MEKRGPNRKKLQAHIAHTKKHKVQCGKALPRGHTFGSKVPAQPTSGLYNSPTRLKMGPS